MTPKQLAVIDRALQSGAARSVAMAQQWLDNGAVKKRAASPWEPTAQRRGRLPSFIPNWVDVLAAPNAGNCTHH